MLSLKTSAGVVHALIVNVGAKLILDPVVLTTAWQNSPLNG